MSHRWLLSLLCLSVLFLSLVQLTRARGELRVNEVATRVLFEKGPAEALLAVENSSGETVNARVEVELLDPGSKSRAKTSQTQTIARGNQTLRLLLPLSISNLNEKERSLLLWYRLRYRLTDESSPANAITEGIISLSGITPELFEVRVTTTGVTREGARYRARAQVFHPLTLRPAVNVRVDGEVTLEADEGKKVKLHASKTTDSRGYASLDFLLPSEFPEFPHRVHASGGEINVKAQMGAIVAEAKGDVFVDQHARIFINSDKPLYQPGQLMHIRALLFTPTMRALANQNILIRITDPEEISIFRTIVKSSRFGVVSTDWSIPENTRLGDYRIWVGVDGEDSYAQSIHEVRVSRYDLPNFSVTVDPDRKYYLPGQNAEVKVRADYVFGKPVARGRVRVVRESERQWNYREQKWDIEEGDKYEGETDAKGFFVAHIKLASEHKDISDSDYRRFKDVTYAAYFTDPTTNRTEQRRFDLRVTKEAIHVYAVNSNSRDQNRTLPLKFYVSTFYADGSPARCRVSLRLAKQSRDKREQKKTTARPIVTLRTNRYGLAKTNAIRPPAELAGDTNVDLLVSAIDSEGRLGSEKVELSLDDQQTVLVETDKALYRNGEPIIARITSSTPDETVVVDLTRDFIVIRSERVRLNNGRGTVVFTYTPDFKDKLTVAAYADFIPSRYLFGTHTILYPRNSELKMNVRTSQKSYRPGEDAHVNVNIRAPEGGALESALGVVVFDKAVEERFRMDSGYSFNNLNNSVQRFLGLDEQLAGVSLRDLQRTDMSRPVSPELDLLTEILLNRNTYYYPDFFSSSQYETSQKKIFAELTRQPLTSIKDVLSKRYALTADYPKNETELRRFLSESQIDFDALRDPWGLAYRAVFSVDRQSDNLALVSAGADKQFETHDDLLVDRMSWPYFRSVGEAIDRTVHRYHERTGAFIRDSAILGSELVKEGVSLDQLRDRWGEPYRFEFEVRDSTYVINVSSGGPDREVSSYGPYLAGDFLIWTSSIDYFAEQRAEIDRVLTQSFQKTKQFPQTDENLWKALRDFRSLFENLRDPWSHPYYRTYKTQSFYSDRVRLENRASLGQSPTTRAEITPVTQEIAFLTLRSMGPDGKDGTRDDFTVATFNGVISEQARGQAQPQKVGSGVVLSGSNGAISGVVTDVNGAVIPGAAVTATRSADGQRYYSSSTDDGKYSFTDLPPAEYELRFEKPGFIITVVTDVLVRPSNIAEVNVTLEVGSVAQAVMVTDSAANAMQANTDASVNASRSTVANNTVITKPQTSRQISTPRLRQYFPETLLWQPSIETDKQGRARINFKLADNITTWKMAVVGSTEDGLVGATETEINAFQPFFVDHDPPRVLTEGDEISLPVVVRNYLDRAQNVDLEIKAENWFSLLGPARKRTTVPAGDAKPETFDFRTTSSIKDAKQRITATGVDDSDAIEKPITVHPDGEEVSLTAGDIFGNSALLELHVPEIVIPGSRQGELKIYPNPLAHVVESVEAIMARPYGCGEQAISTAYPSLLLLRHYKQSGDDFPLRARAQRYVKDSYSRLLNYRDEGGGFTYWGRGESDVALTAYALRFLAEASDVIPVDQQVINQARDWLIKQQATNGSWPAKLYWSNTEDYRRTAVLTAYVTRMIAMSRSKLTDEQSQDTQKAPNVSVALKRALDYLDQRGNEIDEPHLLASYALAAIDAGDASRAKPVLEKLRTLAHAEGSTTYWSLETNTPFYGWGIAGRVESTALVVQALNKECRAQIANCEANAKLIRRALLFLLKQKDRYGVWYSTQATINVLDAMLTLLSTNSVNQSNAAVQPADILVNGRVVQTIQIPVNDRLSNPITLDISQFLQTGKNRVEIVRSSDSPFATVHALVNYYVPWTDGTRETSDLRLLAKFDKSDGRINDVITSHVEAERIGFRGYGMMLAEIGLPPGADVDRSSLDAAMESSNWAISQYDVLPDRVVLYLWPRAGGVKFNFKFRPRFGMNAKTPSSVVYDYYNPESRAVVPPARFRVR